MKNDEKIIKKLVEHDERFDRIDKRLTRHTEKFLEHDEQLEFIKENMATKEEMGEIKISLDKVLEIATRLDEERLATYQWIKRIETGVEQHGKELEKQKAEIKKIKLKLKVA